MGNSSLLGGLGLGAGFLFFILVNACVSDSTPIVFANDGGNENQTNDGSTTTGNDGSSSANDGAAPACTASQTTCNGNTLHACRSDQTGFDDTPCATTCVTTPTAHCTQIVPSANGVVAGDLDGTGLMPLVLAADTTINSDTGAISGGIRAANTDPTTRTVTSGIAFHQVTIPGAGGAKIGIFSVSGLNVGDGKIVTAIGTSALAIVSTGDVQILGTLDLRGTCATTTTTAGGPGGGSGGSVTGVATGGGAGAAGASNVGQSSSGGGGGGYGDNGGETPQVGSPISTAGGVVYGNTTLGPLLGGSGGGRGGDASSTIGTSGGNGGGGGGAVQLVSLTKIDIGGGSAEGGINAGGCGGQGATAMTSNPGNGGGGGSGGAILLEAPVVKIDTFGILAVNGAGGGGGAQGAGANAEAGDSGKMQQTQAVSGGAAIGANCSTGGGGGASVMTPSVTIGATAAPGAGGCTGGGGGGVGRIRANTLSGVMTLVAPSATSFVSPQLTDMNSHGDIVSTQGTISLQ